jgi:hypothetical protein
MNKTIQLTNTMHPLRNLFRRHRRFLLIASTAALACFGLSSPARAVSPPPDGGYANQNTAEGEDALLDLTSGAYNTAIGFDALLSNTSGTFNTATGADALESNTTGVNNTATGTGALSGNTTGGNNTANGDNALGANTTGNNNTATGFAALFSNTTGSGNTATGEAALIGNSTGSNNTATGLAALNSNGTGGSNTATGFSALDHNTSGSNNTANGSLALGFNTTGLSNTATGSFALEFNTTGGNNTANGDNALISNGTGSFNTANGVAALFSNTSGTSNTAEGINALLHNTVGSNNIALGASAGSSLTTGSNNIDIAAVGLAAESNTIRIGKVGTQQATYIAGVSGKTVAGGVTVVVDTNGHLGTVVSSERFKDAIKPMDKASEAILSLQPVTFHYKHELDPEGIPQFGLVAEQVAKVDPDLVARDAAGKPYTVRYEAVNAMLLNEFLKEHRRVAELNTTVAEQQKEIQTFMAILKAQAAQLQKVSDAIEMSKPGSKLLANTK